MAETKPFGISKRAVWEAYRRVRKNGGAAGVDRQSLEAFERDLSSNPYKLWNRLASGSLLCPACADGRDTKGEGWDENTGDPDRRGQGRANGCQTGPSSRRWSLISILTRMGTDRLSRRCKQWASHVSDAGSMTTCWNLTSKDYLMRSITACCCERWTSTRTADGYVYTSNDG